MGNTKPSTTVTNWPGDIAGVGKFQRRWSHHREHSQRSFRLETEGLYKSAGRRVDGECPKHVRCGDAIKDKDEEIGGGGRERERENNEGGIPGSKALENTQQEVESRSGTLGEGKDARVSQELIILNMQSQASRVPARLSLNEHYRTSRCSGADQNSSCNADGTRVRGMNHGIACTR